MDDVGDEAYVDQMFKDRSDALKSTHKIVTVIFERRRRLKHAVSIVGIHCPGPSLWRSHTACLFRL
jgi:hypothetical protein